MYNDYLDTRLKTYFKKCTYQHHINQIFLIHFN